MSQRRRRERSAGAFMGPGGLIPAPLRTLCDDYHDAPTEPVDSDRVPEPEPPSALRRLAAAIVRRVRPPA